MEVRSWTIGGLLYLQSICWPILLCLHSYLGPIPEYMFNSSINLSNCTLDESDVEHRLFILDPSKGTGRMISTISCPLTFQFSTGSSTHSSLLWAFLTGYSVRQTKNKLICSFILKLSSDCHPTCSGESESLVLDYVNIKCKSLLWSE